MVNNFCVQTEVVKRLVRVEIDSFIWAFFFCITLRNFQHLLQTIPLYIARFYFVFIIILFSIHPPHLIIIEKFRYRDACWGNIADGIMQHVGIAQALTDNRAHDVVE